MNAEQIMKIFADTAYIRTGGSPEELRTAQYLQDKIAGLGLKAEIVPLDVPMSRIQEAVLQVDGVEVNCMACLSASSPRRAIIRSSGFPDSATMLRCWPPSG